MSILRETGVVIHDSIAALTDGDHSVVANQILGLSDGSYAALDGVQTGSGSNPNQTRYDLKLNRFDAAGNPTTTGVEVAPVGFYGAYGAKLNGLGDGRFDHAPPGPNDGSCVR